MKGKKADKCGWAEWQRVGCEHHVCSLGREGKDPTTSPLSTHASHLGQNCKGSEELELGKEGKASLPQDKRLKWVEGRNIRGRLSASRTQGKVQKLLVSRPFNPQEVFYGLLVFSHSRIHTMRL